MSRWAFPATLDHLLTLTAVGILWRCLPAARNAERNMQNATPDKRRAWFIVHVAFAPAVAGALAGLAAYAYHTGRLSPVILGALVLVRIGWDREAWRRALPALVAAALAGLLVLAPLIQFIAAESQGYNRRTSAVAVFNTQDPEMHAPLLLVLRNVERYILMWHVEGEPNGRHHAPGAPMLDPVTGLLFALGLGAALLARRRGDVALLVWLPLSLVPGIFSTDAPHAMRSLGALAPACMIAGAALGGLMQNATCKMVVDVHFACCILHAAALAASLAFNLWLYFGAMPHDPRVYREFYVAETAMGRVAQAPPVARDPAARSVRVFLPASDRDEDVVRYMTSGVPVGWFDGERLSSPPGAQAVVLLPKSASAAEREATIVALGPGAREIDGVPRDPAGEPLFAAFAVGEAPERLLREVFGPP
jgi:hypothetical protein